MYPIDRFIVQPVDMYPTDILEGITFTRTFVYCILLLLCSMQSDNSDQLTET